jgi:ABC-type phosphate transport system permease subunit
MRNIHDLMLRLSPFSRCSFRRRFFAVLIAWGIPFFLAEIFFLRLYRYPSELPFALALQVPSIVVGALGVALLEHLINHLVTRKAEGREAKS